MHELTGQELYQAIAYARSLDEQQGKQILTQFAQEQSGLYQTLFGFLPTMISEQHQEMGYLFMDLCFDVLCVFQQAFGKPPHDSNNPAWLQKQAALLAADLQAFNDRNLDETTQRELRGHLAKPSPYAVSQPTLLAVLHEAIDEYAAENSSRVQATQITQAMMGITIKLFCSLYETPTQH